jgi:D-alanyl-D-alanine carboxypeptidase/D-alanyl-D-alanine-endopeptidase (penicillin-binding protein 4)
VLYLFGGDLAQCGCGSVQLSFNSPARHQHQLDTKSRLDTKGRSTMLLRLFILLLLAPVVQAQEWKKLLDLAPEGSQLALVVAPLSASGALQIDYRSDILLPPASTLKLFTATAAELALGPEYRFHTRLWQRGRQRGGRWQGDLLFEFTGAPDLDVAQLGELLTALRQRGVREIEGNILLDTSRFSGYDRAHGWPWNNLSVCYSAPVAALTLEGNCIQASLNSRGPGQPARFYVPPHQPIEVTANVVVLPEPQIEQRLCELEARLGPGNRYQLSGCISDQRDPLPLNFAINDPIAHGKARIRQELSRQGIVLKGTIVPGVVGDDWQPLAQVTSAPLAELLQQTLQRSDNLIADLLLKTLAVHSGEPGSFAGGVRAMKRIIGEHTGVDLHLAALSDGSGLSRDDLVQARQLAQLLRWLAAHPQLHSYQALPISGRSGTLTYRASTRNPPLQGAIKAKTGSVNGSRNLAGYIDAASGERYLFVLLLSGIHLPDEPRPGPSPVTRFERELLEWIYHNG